VPEDTRPFTPLDVWTILWRGRRWVIAFPLAFAVLAVVQGSLTRRSYTTTVVFAPEQGGRTPAQFAGIAAQFGLAVGGVETSESPLFYADLVRTWPILAAVTESTYTLTSDSGPVTATLVELFRAPGTTPEQQRSEAARRLLSRTAVSVRTQTGVVRLSVRTFDPDLSEQVAARFLTEINAFNLRSRQSRAGNERQFVEDRLAEARDSLTAAEVRLRRFQEQNRSFSAPELGFEEGRLEREVMTRQQVFTTLAQAFEQARIDEVRNTPVLTVIEGPRRAAWPDARRRLLRAFVGAVVGGMIGITVAFAIDGVAAAGRDRSLSRGGGEPS